MRLAPSLAALFAAGALSAAALAGPAGAITGQAAPSADTALLFINPITDVKCFVVVKGHVDLGLVVPNNLSVRLFGDDATKDVELARESPFSTTATGDYSARFSLPCATLNEDPDPFDQDEIYALVAAFDKSTGLTKELRSNIHIGDF